MKFDKQAFIDNESTFVEIIKSHNTNYPHDYQRLNAKSELLVDSLINFKGCRLLDLGSNFGMYSMLSAQYAKSVVGIERDKKICNASISSKEHFESLGFDLFNVNFLNLTANDIIKFDFNALLLSLVLYHLNDIEINMLIHQLKSNIDTVIIQCRPSRAISYESGKLPDYVSACSVYSGLYRIEDNLSLLHDCGFNKIEVTKLPSLYYGEDFPIIVGRK